MSLPVRTIERDSDTWFVARDVCDVLELGNTGQALSRLADNVKSSIILNDGTSNGGNPNMSIINESGMYNLAFSSRKPAAVAFRQWVTSEVIPTIRKTGKYKVRTHEPR